MYPLFVTGPCVLQHLYCADRRTLPCLGSVPLFIVQPVVTTRYYLSIYYCMPLLLCIYSQFIVCWCLVVPTTVIFVVFVTLFGDYIASIAYPLPYLPSRLRLPDAVSTLPLLVIDSRCRCRRCCPIFVVVLLFDLTLASLRRICLLPVDRVQICWRCLDVPRCYRVGGRGAVVALPAPRTLPDIYNTDSEPRFRCSPTPTYPHYLILLFCGTFIYRVPRLTRGCGCAHTPALPTLIYPSATTYGHYLAPTTGIVVDCDTIH